ncbi:XdhC family protein [Pantoea sp. C2G6]|uniref:XdhC family protein n=1 Tax=Pantoea sp. C2G6 TaxID=3243084 RepID=UPI003EDB2DA2
MGIFSAASQLESENQAFALLQIIEHRGSVPRHSATMLVPEQGPTTGTIGGGMMERLAIEQARAALAEGSSRVFHGKLARQGADAVGADCGGAMTIHIAVYPRRPELFLMGAGHVNRALAQLAVPLGFTVTLADPWAENLQHPDLPACCERAGGESFTEIIRQLKLTRDSYVVVATNHQDREVLEQLMPLPLAYLGLLASRRKAQHFRQLLQKELSVTVAQLATLHSPVGLNIEAETPEEIAVSILAEMVQHYRQRQRKTGALATAKSTAA